MGLVLQEPNLDQLTYEIVTKGAEDDRAFTLGQDNRHRMPGRMPEAANQGSPQRFNPETFPFFTNTQNRP